MRAIVALCSALPVLFLLPRPAVAAGDVYTGPGIAMYGDLKYGPDFTHFDYTNPAAPKGGEVKLAATGTFDSFNPFIIKGNPAAGLNEIYDTLLVPSADEPFSEYGLLAEKVEVPADRSWVAFTLRKEARWHDGKPVTADDVVWTFDTLRREPPLLPRLLRPASPRSRRPGERSVKFTFKPGENRELPLIVGQLVVLPKHYWAGQELRRHHPGAPARQRPLQDRRLRGRPLGEVPARRRLLGQGPRGERRAQQLRRHPLRLLPRLDRRAGGVQGRRLRLPPGDVGQGLGDLLRRPRRAQRRARQGRDPQRPPRRHAGLSRSTSGGRSSRTAGCARRMAYAFDFEWTNKTLFYGQYTRTRSYFDNSELAATGLPSPQELALLEPYRGRVPDEVFTQGVPAAEDRRLGRHPRQPAPGGRDPARRRLAHRSRRRACSPTRRPGR